LFLTIKNLLFNDINQGITKQLLGTEKVWSFFLAFSDKDKIEWRRFAPLLNFVTVSRLA